MSGLPLESPAESVDSLEPPVYEAYRHIRSLVQPGSTVLDVGCGNGKVGAYLAVGGAVVDGIEPSSNRAEIARSRLHYVSSVPVPATHDDPRLALKYDLVLLLDVVEHVVDPQRIIAWAMSRVEAKGKLVILIPNSVHWSFRKQIMRGSWRYEESGLFDRTHLRFYDPETARALRPAGMDEAAVHHFTPGSWAHRAALRYRPRLFALHIMLEWIPVLQA